MFFTQILAKDNIPGIWGLPRYQYPRKDLEVY